MKRRKLHKPLMPQIQTSRYWEITRDGAALLTESCTASKGTVAEKQFLGILPHAY